MAEHRSIMITAYGNIRWPIVDGRQSIIWKLSIIAVVLYILINIIGLFYGIVHLSLAKYFLAAVALMGSLRLIVNIHAIGRSEAVGLLLMFLIVLAMLLQVWISPELVDNLNRSSHIYLVKITIINMCWIMTGYAIQTDTHIAKSNIIACILVVFVFVIIGDALDGNYVIDYSAFEDNISQDINETHAANHLVAGDLFYLLLLAAYSFSKPWTRIFIAVASIIALFALGGRANLALYVMSVIIYEWTIGTRRKKFRLTILMLIAFVIISTVSAQLLSDDPSVNRMFFSGGLEDDGSALLRFEQIVKNMTALPQQILVGDLSYLIILHNTLGSYTHNILSMWQFYGLLPFVLTCWLLISKIRKIRKIKTNFESVVSTFENILFISVALGMLSAKSITWPLLWFAMGLVMMDAKKIRFNKMNQNTESSNSISDN